MAFRHEYTKALELLAQACEALHMQGFERPVLVGGAAVEFYTNSDVVSGDFDVITPHQKALEVELLKLGFTRPDHPGQLHRGVHHPEFLIGVEVVSGQVFDGLSDCDRHTIIDLATGKIEVISAEDIIADRMGQYNSAPNGVPEMLEQARYVYNLAEIQDLEYLDRRIREETANDFGLSEMLELIDENRHA